MQKDTVVLQRHPDVLRLNGRLIGSHHHKELQMSQWRLKTRARKSSELSPIIIIPLV